METHYDFTDEQFEQQFKSCTLSPSLFNHEAHLRLAWIHVTKHGVEQAIENICIQLVNFVAHIGATDKYNKTLTIAATRAVNHFVSKSTSSTFPEFINEFPRLKNNFKELMASHYQVDIFNLPLAKIEYVEPDLVPFS